MQQQEDKKAVLSQRWPRDAPYVYGRPENFQESLTTNTATFPENFYWAFVPIEPINVRAKFEIRSFTRCWDNRGYPKNLGSPWICPRFLFPKIFHGLLFGWTLWMYWLNLKSVAFTVPEIINRVYPKNLGSPWIRPRSLFSKILMGFCSDGPSECTGQIWNP